MKGSSILRLVFPSGLLALALLFVCSPSTSAQNKQQSLKLAHIIFQGLVSVPQDVALKTAGLNPGDTITLDSIDVAAQRLVDSGLFSKLSYHVKSTGKTNQDATLTFVVSEQNIAIPVVFDNFVWFSEQELFNAVKAEVPSFNGLAPEAGRATESINNALSRLLKVAGIGGTVTHAISTNFAGGGARHVFTVSGVSIPICGVHFRGAEDVKEEFLIEKSRALLGTPFSREFVNEFPRPNLLPIYRQAGHLKAGISFESTKVNKAESCKNGVDVNYLVDEGPVYTWAGSEWTGNLAVATEELLGAIGFKRGDRADGLKMDKTEENIRRLYARKGYMGLLMKATPSFDDNARTVFYRFGISEGPQYKMGSVTFEGFSDSDVEKLRKAWSLAPGDAYDAGYANEFIGKSVAPLLSGGPANRKISITDKPNIDKQNVDVVIALK